MGDEYSWEKFSQNEPDEPENYWFPEGEDMDFSDDDYEGCDSAEEMYADTYSTFDTDDYEYTQQF